MDPLDDELRSALKRRPAPEGFEARLMARIAASQGQREEQRGGLLRWLLASRLAWAATTAIACLLIFAGVYRHRQIQRERIQGEIAKAQVMKALHIASTKLNVALQKAHAIERPLPET